MQREKNNQVTDQMICHSNVRLVAQTADHGVPQCLSFSVLANMKKKMSRVSFPPNTSENI